MCSQHFSQFTQPPHQTRDQIVIRGKPAEVKVVRAAVVPTTETFSPPRGLVRAVRRWISYVTGTSLSCRSRPSPNASRAGRLDFKRWSATVLSFGPASMRITRKPARNGRDGEKG